MADVAAIHRELVDTLVQAGRRSPHNADANEPDSRYRAYGVRAPARREFFKRRRAALIALDRPERIELADRLIRSGFGEQQELAWLVLQPLVESFTREDLPQVDAWLRRLHGWSKIDGYCSVVLQPLLLRFPDDLLARARIWNQDADPWPRRASVVLFTRKVARSGRFTDVALELCHALRFDEHDLVRKGVGWCLQDLMACEPDRIGGFVKGLRREGVSSVITLYAVRRLRGPQRDEILAVKPR